MSLIHILFCLTSHRTCGMGRECVFARLNQHIPHVFPTQVQALLAAGVDPNSKDYDGRTPLHLAAVEGRQPVVSLLLSHNASTDSVDRFGKTPLDEAEKHPDIATLIREAQ